jgi:2-polyprenyl-6-methoxyphenol hydroxylase-like FAD-dependent oxidoreductase
MLLARKGYKVLLVDRAHFPSDSPLANLIQLKGCAALKRWGLLERVQASNCPPVSKAILQMAHYSLKGEYLPLDGIGATVCPRRPILDKILVEAAAEAGVEIRGDLVVEGVLTDNGQVTGVRFRQKSIQGAREIKVEEKAKLVVGADGKHSLIAKSVQAPEYQVKPILACVYYTYWEGFGPTNGELYYLSREALGLWPTNNGLINIFVAYPVNEFQAIRGNIEDRFWRTVESVPGMVERLRNGRRVERFYGTADLPAFYRRPYGPGWALVGDAGMTLDPFTGQGIGNAFRDVERLVDAVDAGFSGRLTLEAALAIYEHERNEDTLPMYEFTERLAAFGSLLDEQRLLLAALVYKPEGIRRLLGALSGSISLNEFFSPASMLHIVGMRGMLSIFSSRLKQIRANSEQ